jgi:hypothetical protein
MSRTAAAGGWDTLLGAEIDDSSGEPWQLQRAAELQVERYRGAHIGNRASMIATRLPRAWDGNPTAISESIRARRTGYSNNSGGAKRH